MSQIGVLLYGPPASGKDTVTKELCALNNRYHIYPRIKSGPGKREGYRAATDAEIERLLELRKVLWENRRYGARYVVECEYLSTMLTNGLVPVVHLGQVDAVAAIRRGMSRTKWLTVSLWCCREQAHQRIISRGSTDVADRLAAWDATEALTNADLYVDTGATSAHHAAEAIHEAAKALGLA